MELRTNWWERISYRRRLACARHRDRQCLASGLVGLWVQELQHELPIICGRGPRGIRTSKARTGLRTRLACHRRWSVYGNLCRHTPEAGAVCGKAARTDLGGGRAMKCTSLPLLERREFISLLGGAAAWPLAASAQQPSKLPTIGFLGQSTPVIESRRLAAFLQRSSELGWVEGRTIAIEYAWG